MGIRWSELDAEIRELKARINAKKTVMGILRNECIELQKKIDELEERQKDIGIY